MGKHHVITTGDMKRIEELTQQGLSQVKIAKEIGCSSSAVSLCRRRIGLTSTAKGKALTKEQLDKIEALSRSRWTQLDISKEVGCSIDAVRHHQQKLGIPASNRSEATGQHCVVNKEVAMSIVPAKPKILTKTPNPGEWIDISDASIKIVGNKTSFNYSIGLLNGEVFVSTGYGDPIPLDSRDIVAFGNELLDIADKIDALKKAFRFEENKA